MKNLGEKDLSEEDFECEAPMFNLYFFAEDILGDKGPKPVYHIALFTKNNKRYFAEMGNEVFISLDDFIENPIVTLERLKFLADSISYKWGQDYYLKECYRFNKVPDMFSKNKHYRPLYDFEKWDIIP